MFMIAKRPRLPLLLQPPSPPLSSLSFSLSFSLILFCIHSLSLAGCCASKSFQKIRDQLWPRAFYILPPSPPPPSLCLLAALAPLEALYVTLSAFACCFLYVNSLLAFYSHMRSFSLFIVYLNRLRIRRMCCCFSGISGISAMWRTYVLRPRLQLMTVAN